MYRYEIKGGRAEGSLDREADLGVPVSNPPHERERDANLSSEATMHADDDDDCDTSVPTKPDKRARVIVRTVLTCHFRDFTESCLMKPFPRSLNGDDRDRHCTGNRFLPAVKPHRSIEGSPMTAGQGRGRKLCCHIKHQHVQLRY